MKLSVIIVSYNVKYYLQQCIESVRRAINGIDAEICVIDNHSRDNTVGYLRKHNKDLRIIASNHNNGFARANNIFIQQTESEYVLLLNPDTIVGEEVLHDCIQFMDSHPQAGGLGVRMLKVDGHGKPTWAPHPDDLALQDVWTLQPFSKEQAAGQILYGLPALGPAGAN